VVINLVCYRRLGHNEQDDPSITLPLLSERIKRQRKVSEIYADRLVSDGVATRAEVAGWIERCAAEYQAELDAAGTYVESPEDWAVSTYMGQRDSALNVGERLRLEKELRLELDAHKTLEEEGVIVEDGPGGPRAVSQAGSDEASSSGNGDVATTAGSSRFESIEGLDANPRFNPRMFSTGVPLEMIRAVGHAMTELPPENLDNLDAKFDGAYGGNGRKKSDLDDLDDETARTKAEKDYGVSVGDSVRTAKALLSQLDDVARKARLEHMGLFPPDFIAHPHTRKLLENRRKMVDGELGVDWGTAELLAFATLTLHRYPGEDPAAPPRKHCHVRLSGQDVERGTFNHRHSVLYCSRTSRPVNPIDNMGLGDQDRFLVCNSPLSEHAVMGFEYGFSVDSGPAALVLWEAQFGDFANNAQGIVDQFVATGEAKWWGCRLFSFSFPFFSFPPLLLLFPPLLLLFPPLLLLFPPPCYFLSNRTTHAYVDSTLPSGVSGAGWSSSCRTATTATARTTAARGPSAGSRRRRTTRIRFRAGRPATGNTPQRPSQRFARRRRQKRSKKTVAGHRLQTLQTTTTRAKAGSSPWTG